MSHKDAKKMRQLFNREVRGQIDVTVDALRRLIRAKPWYIPRWVWIRIVRVVIPQYRV